MKKIPIDIVLEYWQEHQARTPDDVFSCLRKLYDQQYAMMGYVMKAEGDGLNDEEHQAMYYLGSFIIYVMMQEFPSIPAVPEDTMLKARELNVNMLGYLGTNECEDIHNLMDNIIDGHPQSDLLRRQKAPPFMAGMNGFLGRSSDLCRSVGTHTERSPVIYHGESSLKFILETLIGDPQLRKSIRDIEVWYIFAHLKIVIDALSNSIVETSV